ncbi:phage tail protein [Halomonas sp. I1]|uniref:TipJ family phage tail tip protein n=1 Tax=Halomonas sp. I1 TaxID=393536 RepID=UPI0028DD6425|nr:phage tail protein [Halomonas sp. I1]MDT8894171.1 phage tail protein [Halomonas sp. I1]
MDPILKNAEQIQGEKGGKGGGGSQRVPREAPNTLRSASKARIIDLIGEGPIVGLADDLKSIYLDDTPLQNEDGSFNFDGVNVYTREGDPDQAHIPGFPAVETVQDVSVQVTQGSPVVRSITNQAADAVRVTVQLPALSRQNKENGDLLGTSVEVAIDVRPDGGAWQEARRDLIEGKTTSPYQRTYRCELPGSAPWEVRVRRLTEDSDSAVLSNDTYWASYTEVIDAKLSYPDSALVALEVDAQQFGSTIPSRSYDLKGRIIRVPSNYDPEARTYSGIWDGSFKLAWSDNPAWIYYDLAGNARYGADLANVDKWGLYTIGQYCDELVPDGYGGEEPRFTFNTQMANAEEAFTALQTLASAFRGMTYWGTNTVMAVADMPAEPAKLVGPANVIGGEFQREGSGLKARHSVALVTWNDPEDGYRQQIEVIEDPDAIQQYGWRKTEVVAAGCTSRGQAHRMGKWILYSERAETETLSYRAGLDHADLRPGEIIAVSDPARAGARLTGRLLATGIESLTLDAVPDDTSNGTWYLDVVMPSGGIERREIASFDGQAVELTSPLSAEPVDGAMWVLSSSSVEPEHFRVLSVTEEDAHTYAITALAHDPDKFARVEQGLDLPERPDSLVPTGPVIAPLSIDVQAFTYLAGGTEHQGLSISWTPSDDPRVMRYRLEVKGPEDVSWRTIYTGEGTSVSERDTGPGQWQIRVAGVTGIGNVSPWATLTTNVAGLLMPTPPDSVDISVGTLYITLNPVGQYPGQQFEFWRSSAPLETGDILSNAVHVGTGTTITDNERTPLTTYYYYVRGTNAYGKSDWYPVQATTEGDPSALITAISGEIGRTEVDDELRSELDQISTNSGAIADVQGRADQIRSDLTTEVGRLDGRANQIRDDLTDAEGRLGTIEDSVGDIETNVGDAVNRITSVEALAESNEGAVNNLALDVSTLEERTDDAEASIIETQRIDELNGILEAVTSSVSSVQNAVGSASQSVETINRISKDGVLLQRQELLEGEFEDADGRINDIVNLALSPGSALLTRFGQIEGSVDDVNGRVTNVENLDISADSALITRLNELEGEAGNASGLAQDIIDLNLGQNTAIINRFESIEGSVGDVSGAVQDVVNLDISPSSALIGRFETIEGTVNDPDTGVAAAHAAARDIRQMNLSSSTALVSRFETIEGNVSNVQGSIQDIQNLDISPDSALIERFSTLEGTVNDPDTGVAAAHAAAKDIRQLNLSSATALISRFETIEGNVSNAQGSIQDIRNLDIATGSALIQRFESVEGNVSNVDGRVDDVINLDLSSSSALIDRFETVEGSVGGVNGRVDDVVSLNFSEGENYLVQRFENIEAATADGLSTVRSEMRAELDNQSLIADGSFSTGDGSLWNSTNDVNIVERDPGGPPVDANSPAAHFAEFTADYPGGNRHISGPYRPVSPGDIYTVKMDYTARANTDGTLRLSVQWRDSSGSNFDWPTVQTVNMTPVAGGNWETTEPTQVTVPAGAIEGRIVVSAQDTTDGKPVFTNVVASRSDAAMAERIDTVQVQLGEDIAGVQTKAETAIDDAAAQGERINAMWSLKVQANNRISGIVLGNDGQEALFGISADRLYIADPDDPDNADLGFIYDNGQLLLREALIASLTFGKLTDSSGNFIVDNQGRLKAQYIDVDNLNVDWANIQNVNIKNADIDNGEIDWAKLAFAYIGRGRIGDLAVNTVKIADQAVIIPVSRFTAARGLVPMSTWGTLQTATVNPRGARVEVMFHWLWEARDNAQSDSDKVYELLSNLQYRLTRNGNIIASGVLDKASLGICSFPWLTGPLNGNQTFRLEVKGGVTSGTRHFIMNRYIGLKAVRK